MSKSLLEWWNELRVKTYQGFFGVFSGAKMWPHSQWNLGAFFPILKKNPNLQKEFFLKIGIFIQSTNTHMLHGDILLQLNDNSMCNSLFVFLLTKNDIIVHYYKSPNLGGSHANFLNLKGPRAPSQNCQKKILHI